MALQKKNNAKKSCSAITPPLESLSRSAGVKLGHKNACSSITPPPPHFAVAQPSQVIVKCQGIDKGNYGPILSFVANSMRASAKYLDEIAKERGESR